MAFQTELIQSLLNNADRTAIEQVQGNITYATLLNRADAVTNALLKEGPGKEGTTVGIYLNDRCDMIATVIGILNARCVFVLLDGALPAERLQSIIHNLELSYLITSKYHQAPAIGQAKVL